MLSYVLQGSSSSLDYYQAQAVSVDDKGERRGSVEGRHQRLERKNSGNDRQGHYDKAKRSSLERWALSTNTQAWYKNKECTILDHLPAAAWLLTLHDSVPIILSLASCKL